MVSCRAGSLERRRSPTGIPCPLQVRGSQTKCRRRCRKPQDHQLDPSPRRDQSYAPQQQFQSNLQQSAPRLGTHMNRRLRLQPGRSWLHCYRYNRRPPMDRTHRKYRSGLRQQQQLPNDLRKTHRRLPGHTSRCQLQRRPPDLLDQRSCLPRTCTQSHPQANPALPTRCPRLGQPSGHNRHTSRTMGFLLQEW